MAFGSTRRNGADRDIYVMDPRDPATTRRVLEVKGGGWGPTDWSPDDTKLLVDRGHLGQRELRLGGGRRDRREDARRPRRAARSRSPTRGPGGAPTARGSTSPPTASPSSSASPTSTSRPASTPPHVAHPVGRGQLRALARRADDRVRDERGRRERPAPARHGQRQGEAARRSSRWASSAASSGTTTAATSASSSPRRARRPTSTRVDVTHREARALDRERDGRPQRAGLLRARARALEELRRADDLRLPLQAAQPASPARGR